jgi:hypothetical protein
MNSSRTSETGGTGGPACTGLLVPFLFVNNVLPGLNSASASLRRLAASRVCTAPRKRTPPTI